MSKNIKGITIEIDGNTSPLDKALKATTDKSVAFNSEIKDINRNLKFDPTNTTLLAQKQKVLADAIKNTNEHLKVLKAAEQQYPEKDIESEQYRSLQREIIKTEQTLNTYTAEVKQATAAQLQMSASTKAAYDQLDRAASTGLMIATGALVAMATAATQAARAGWTVASSAGNAADELLTQSQQTGLATRELQGMGYAARFVDVETETMTKTMAKNIKSMQSAADGSKNVEAAYRALNVEYQNADKTLRDGKTVYFEVIDALGKMENQTQRDAYSMLILGKSAQDVNPLIKAGTGELRRLTDEAESLGIILDEKTVKSLGRFDDAAERIEAQASSFKSALVAGMAEPLESIGETATKSFAKLQKSATNGKIKQSMNDLGESIEVAGDKIINAAEKAIPKIVKGFEWLVDNGEQVVATTVSITAAFATAKAAFAISKIINAATASYAAYKAAQLAGAAATGTATAAQLGFNAALLANPIGLIATALAALIAGVATYALTCPKAQTETQKLNADLKDLHDEIANGKQAYEENLTSLTNEAIASAALVNRMDVLTSKTTLTAAEQAELNAIVQKLNESYDGLNLAYDEQSKTLNKTISSIKDYTKAKYAEAKATESTDRAIELLDQQAQAKEHYIEASQAEGSAYERLTLLQNKYTDAIAAGADARAVASQYGQDIINASNDYYAAAQAAQGYKSELDGVNQSITQNETALQGYLTASGQYTTATDGAADSTNNFKWRNYDLQSVLDATGLSADDAGTKLDNYAKVTQNAFELIESTVNLTASELTKNLLGNQANMDAFAANIETVASRTTSAGDTIDSGFIQVLRDMGLEASGTVANLATANQADFDALAAAWETGGDAAVKALLTEMGAGETEIQDAGGKAVQDAIDGLEAKQTELDTAVSKVITDSRAKAYTAVENANFSNVGYQIPAGIAKGVRNGYGVLRDAIDYIIEQALKRAREKADEHSPSQLFADEVGLGMGQGVGVGVYDALGYIKDMIDRTISSSVAYASRAVPAPTATVATAGVTYHLHQNIYSHDALSPSEMMDEGKEFLRRVTRI